MLARFRKTGKRNLRLRVPRGIISNKKLRLFVNERTAVKMPRVVAISLFVLLIVGCVHTTESPPVFTETWHDKTRDAMAEDKARKQAQEILLGDESDTVTVRADEEGRPKVQVGKDRLHADVDVKSGEPRVRLRYKLKWGHAGKDMPSSIPHIPPDSQSANHEEEASNGE